MLSGLSLFYFNYQTPLFRFLCIAMHFNVPFFEYSDNQPSFMVYLFAGPNKFNHHSPTYQTELLASKHIFMAEIQSEDLYYAPGTISFQLS